MDRLALVWNFHCGQDYIHLKLDYIVDRIAMTLNLHYGQDGFDLELTLWTGWHWFGIFTVDRMALT